MAEVGGAIANAVAAVAIAAAVGAIVGLIYFIYRDLVSYIPYVGAALFGAIFALIFNPLNPFLGMGLGTSLGFAAFLPLKVFIVAKWGGTDDKLGSGADMAKSLRTIAQLLCAGPAMGFAHMSTKSIPFSLACAAGAFYLGGKYAWSPLVNFYLDFGLLGDRNCDSKAPNIAMCVSACTAAMSKARRDAVYKEAPCITIRPNDTYTKNWCSQKADWVASCVWDSTAIDPGPYNGSSQGPPATAPCAAYAPYQQPGQYSFGSACGDAQAMEAKLKVVYGWDNPGMLPVTYEEFDHYYGAQSQWNYGMARRWDFVRDNNNNPIDGRVFMTDGDDWPLGNWVRSAAATTDGMIRDGRKGTTCVWKDAGDRFWYTDNDLQAPTGNPLPGPVLNWRDYAAEQGPAYVQSAWKGHRLCVPVGADAAPSWNLSQQPVEADRGSFCKQYDDKKNGVSTIVPFYDVKNFQCQVGNSVQPSHGVPWPW